MKPIFIKSYKKEKFHIKRYSKLYFLAVFVESTAIILWSIGLYEINILHECNPASILVQIGGICFTIGSYIYCKFIKH